MLCFFKAKYFGNKEALARYTTKRQDRTQGRNSRRFRQVYRHNRNKEPLKVAKMAVEGGSKVQTGAVFLVLLILETWKR